MDLLDLVVKILLDDEASEPIGSISDSLQSALTTAATVAATALAATAAAAVGVATALVGVTGEVAEYGDNIDKTSQKLGMSAEAYQEWDAVLRHSGTSMDAARGSMRALTRAAQSGNEAFAELGITQEQLASMSQEELFELTITRLQNVTDESERSRLAMELLGRGSMELGALLNTSSEETQAMRDRVHELGGVMSDDAVKAAARYQDSLQDMQAALGGLKRNLVSEFLPGMATVMDGLANIFSGDSSGAELVSQGIDDIVENLRNLIPEIAEIVRNVAPPLLEAFGEIVLTLGVEMVKMIPDVISDIIGSIVSFVTESGPEVAGAWQTLMESAGTALTEKAPVVLSAIGDVLSSVIQWLVDNGPSIIATVAQTILGVIEEMTSHWPEIVNNVATVIGDVIQWLIDNGPEILSAAMELFSGIGQAILDHGPQILSNIATTIGNVIGAILGAVGRMFAAGIQFVGGLLDGSTKQGEAVRRWFADLPSRLLNALGNVGMILWDAGRAILTGFWDGLKSVWSGITDWVSGIAGTIASLKGPLPYDRTVLIENGRALMYGLQSGLQRGFEEEVEPYISALAGEIEDGMSFSPTVAYSAAGGGYGQVVNNYYIDGSAVDVDPQLAEALRTVAQTVSSRNRKGTVKR